MSHAQLSTGHNLGHLGTDYQRWYHATHLSSERISTLLPSRSTTTMSPQAPTPRGSTLREWGAKVTAGREGSVREETSAWWAPGGGGCVWWRGTPQATGTACHVQRALHATCHMSHAGPGSRPAQLGTPPATAVLPPILPIVGPLRPSPCPCLCSVASSLANRRPSQVPSLPSY